MFFQLNVHIISIASCPDLVHLHFTVLLGTLTSTNYSLQETGYVSTWNGSLCILLGLGPKGADLFRSILPHIVNSQLFYSAYIYYNI